MCEMIAKQWIKWVELGLDFTTLIAMAWCGVGLLAGLLIGWTI